MRVQRALGMIQLYKGTILNSCNLSELICYCSFFVISDSGFSTKITRVNEEKIVPKSMQRYGEKVNREKNNKS